MNGIVRRIGLMLFGFGVALIVAEVTLAFYDPFEIRVRSDRIYLPVNHKYVIENPSAPDIDEVITHTKNSLGFRGAEPPSDFDEFLTIVAVGGSTTESVYISDGNTWTDHMGTYLSDRVPDLWVNNAGLDGHSTFGHTILTREYLSEFSPDVVVYLVGLNDRGRTDLIGGNDATLVSQGIKRRLKTQIKRSKLITLVYDYLKIRSESQRVFQHHFGFLSDYPSIDVDPVAENDMLVEHASIFVPLYASRLTDLVRLSRKIGTEPVLVTQTSMFGDFTDPTTGIEMGRLVTGTRSGLVLNGRVDGEILDLYNEATRNVAREHNVFLIDLADLLPKDSKYYYDLAHFNNTGSETVGKIMGPRLCEFLSLRQFANCIE
jgi:lysophospholipase L1-like esterase